MEDYRLEQSGQEVQNILDGAAMQTDLTAENERAELAEQTLQGNIDNEALARQNADGVLQGKIDDEEARAKAAEKQNADDIDAIEEKIPSGASAENKLATEDYVDDSVATASATFRGTYNLVTDLHMSTSATRAGIAAALGTAISGADNNDYAFVMIPTSEETPTEIARVERYKFNGTAWGFEYTLNNSGYTSAQWAAINSGITSGLVQKLGPLPSADDLAAALLAKQDKLTFDSAPTPESTNPVTSGGVYTAVDNEKVARQNADQQLQQAIEAILALIPSAATALNQLADKAFVNSSIATDTSTFRGTYNLVTDLHLAVNASHSDIATALLTAASSADNNDYCFVQVPTSVDTPTEIRVTERYKFDGTAWAYEYDLNNSGFTAQQWEAINSAITSALVTKLSALPTAAELATELAGKQAVLTFDNQPTSGSSNPVKSGGVYDVVAAINAKIPSDADAANKMTTEARIATIIGALDATFDLTSADGHVTFKMTQTDGLIASVQIFTYDIASAAALTTLGGRVSLNESDISNLQAAYAALTQSDIVIVNGALPSSGQQQNIIYRQPDPDHTPPQFYSDYMWNGTTWVLMAQYNNAIDPRPKKGSQNLVTSGGVFDNMGALDVSELNATENPHTLATYADLSAALAAIPSDYQKGGMSIKFVQSSTNKYVQYFCNVQTFTSNVDGWEKINLEKEIQVQVSQATNTSNSWMFNDVTFEANHRYYVKHLGGYGVNLTLSIGSSIIDVHLEKDKWIEITSPEAGHPYFYYGAEIAGEQPTVAFADITNCFIPDVQYLNNQLIKVSVNTFTGEESSGHNAWLFPTLRVYSGQKYYVKHISGDLGALFVGESVSTDMLVNGKWIEYTAPATGMPYIFNGYVDQPPVIQITSDKNIAIGEIKRLDSLFDGLDSIFDGKEDKVKWTTINVSYDGTSKTGRTIQFSGLNAIANAINSITDASENNRYIIHVEGEFHFTDPLTLTMLGGGEYSAILMKDYIDIEGDGPDKSVVFVDFPANATFHDGKTFSDYQPIYFYGTGGTIRNMKIAGKNCRYSFHIEAGPGYSDKVINVEECTIVSYGAPDYMYQGHMDCFGTGIANGQIWNIKNCDILNYYNGNAFAMHTPLVIFQKPPVVNLENCRLMGGMYFGNYQVENVTFINMAGCTFVKGDIPTINYSYYNDITTAVNGDYTTVLMNANKMKALYDVLELHKNDGKGVVLKVVSLSTGVNSKVRFAPEASAFNIIIGNADKAGKTNTVYGWDTQYGYVYRDGGVDLNGQAFGTIDIDEQSAGGHNLGNLLGDCTTTNKSLIINIDGANYTITFNENYTDKSNAYVIGKINDVISSVATASVFCPANLYYPSINGLCNVVSADSGPILKGMGVVFTSSGMRKAKNSDGYIDGICLDDTSLGQYGRVITMGYIYYQEGTYKEWFTICHDNNVFEEGSSFGIDLNNDGKFTVNVTPAILRCRSKSDVNSVFEIIE